jgi:hypothetical protein
MQKLTLELLTQKERLAPLLNGLLLGNLPLRPTPHDQKKAAFICEQCDIEIAKGRFSKAFGTDLLPGMYCMPAHAVPKPNSSDLRMVTDHSAGPFSLNSMDDYDLVMGYPLDNMTQLGEMLIRHHLSTFNGRRTVV